MSRLEISNWKEFKIGDLFYCETSPSVDKRYLKFEDDGIYDFIGRTSINNGIQGKINRLNFKPNNKNVFSVTQIGDKICQFRENEWYASQNIFILTPKHEKLCEVPLFITTIITKKMKIIFGKEYNSYPTIKTLPEIKISLPVDLSGSIDFNYIKTFLDNVSSKAFNSLKNMMNIKEAYNKIDTTNWKNYKIIELFDVRNTHSILKSWISEDSGKDPYVTASKENNGVYTYVDYNIEQIEEGNSILIGGKTLVITYQEENYYSNDSHNLALYLKEEKYRNKFIQLFLVTALKSSLNHLYSWGDSISGKAIQKDYIKLPAKIDGTPDYEYMEEYMVKIEAEASRRILDLQDIA